MVADLHGYKYNYKNNEEELYNLVLPSIPRKVIQMAEEILYTLVARVVGAQSLRIIPSRARGTGARKGYARSKAKGKHKLLTGHGTGSYRPHRIVTHRQNVDCDISITHLGGGLDDECTGRVLHTINTRWSICKVGLILIWVFIKLPNLSKIRL